MAFRCDSGQILKHEFTRDGFLRVYSRIARTGELRYRNSEGSERIEVVSPDVLFAKDSIDSHKMIPLTLQHPPERVTPQNARKYQRGMSGHHAIIDGDFLGIVSTVTDAEAIEAITSGRAKQVSCGYDVRTAKRADGKYDQLERIGNHIAIVERGRAGDEVCFKLDADDTDFAIAADEMDAATDVDFSKLETDSEEPKTVVEYKFMLDGVGYTTSDINLCNAAKAVSEKLTAANTRADVAEKEKSTLEGTIAGLQTEVKAAKDAAETRLDADEVAAEVTLRLDAWGEVLPYLTAQDADFKPDYKLDAIDVKRLYLSKRTDADLTSKDAAFIEGMYTALKPPSATEVDAQTGANRVDSMLDGLHTGRTDSSYEAAIERKRKERIERISNNGKALMGGKK